jgi:hypothetical protein
VEMYNIAARKAGVKEITKLSEVPKERITPWYQPQQEQSTNTVQTWTGTINYGWYTLKPM